MDIIKSKRQSGARPKKYKFKGNRYVVKETTAQKNILKSASAKKLSLGMTSEFQEVNSSFQGYRLLDMDILVKELEMFLSCKSCGGDITFEEVLTVGLSSKYSIVCSSCGEVTSFRNSQMIGTNKNVSEINTRAVYAMRCIGQGHTSLVTFCGIMDLPPPLSRKSYDLIVNKIKSATNIVATSSMKNAARYECELNNRDNVITVSGDGTWKTRGYSSLVGVCTVIGDHTGKIIDREVMSSFCKGCEKWKGVKAGAQFKAWQESHQETCLKNHTGSAGKMEVNGMLRIFQRSVEERSVMYGNYIGDGDTKTYSALSKEKPYGTDIPIHKIECVGHIQKRMGTQLRKLKADMRGKKLSDGKSISGRGRLTDKDIDQLTIYYGNAIRQNKDSLVNMRLAVWAVFHHKRSSDEHPSHDFCPVGADSWCKYQVAVATNTVEKYRHTNSLPSAVMDSIKPIFKRLSAPDLLKRCVGGKTQNSNESINSLIWKYCPKYSGCGRKIVDIAVNEAAIIFNEGYKGRLQTLKALELCPGKFAMKAAVNADNIRIATAEIRCQKSTLDSRRAKRRKILIENEKAQHSEGITYAPGHF